MVPLCTLLQAVPISFNGWGLREGLFTLYFSQVGLPRESALAFSLVGAGLMVLLSLSGAVVWMARGSPAPAEPRTPERDGRPGPPRLRQVRRPRARASTGSRACSPGGSPATTARASTCRSCGLKHPEPATELARRAGHPGPPPRTRPLRPADPDRPRRPGPRARGAHPPRPRLRRRRLRAPRRARAPGRSSSSTSTSPTPACPPTRRSPTACCAPLTDGAIAVSRSTRDFLVAGALRPRGARAAHLERRAPRRVRPGRPASARGACAGSSGLPEDGARRRHDRPAERPEGPPLPPRRRGRACCRPSPTARVLIVGDGDLMGELRGQAAGARDRPTGSSSPATAPTCPTSSAPSTCSASPRSTRAPRSPCSRPWPRASAIVSTAVDGCREVLEDGRDRPARAPRATPRPWPAGLERVLRRRRRCATRSGGGPSPPRAATTCSACVDADGGLLRRAARRRRGLRCRSAGSAAALREAWEVPRDLLLGRYPAFVTGGALPRGDVPVFVFHGAEPDSFGRQLEHLADNGYVTLSADEYAGRAPGADAPPPERAVVLTFDDGRGSVWSVAAPLLQPARHEGGRLPRPRPHAPRAPGPLRRPGTTSRPAGPTPRRSCAREDGEGALLSWEEIEALARDRPVRLPEPHPPPRPRAHGAAARRLRHPAVPPRLRRLRPAAPPRRRPRPPGRGGPARHAAPALGAAHLGGAALLRGPRDPRGVRRRGREPGRRGLLPRPDWEARLRRLFARSPRAGPRRDGRGAASGPSGASSRSRGASSRSARAVPCVHLCYPWHAAGPTARRLAAATGYETAFCGKVPGVPDHPPRGRPPARSPALGEDYLELLPGRGPGDPRRGAAPKVGPPLRRRAVP